MDGCLLSRLLDTSSQVLGTIWRCLGKPRGPLWQHFMATVISVSRNSNHSSYVHTLILGKQRWDSYFCSSVFLCVILHLVILHSEKLLDKIYVPSGLMDSQKR